MKNQSFYPFVFLMAFFLCVFTLPAQTIQKNVTKKKKATGRVAYIVYTSGDKFFNKPALVQVGKKVKKMQLNKRYASDPVKFSEDGIIRFVKATPNNPDQPYTPYAIAKIPDGVTKALIVLTPLKKPKKGIYLLAKAVSLAKFKKGDWMFINLSRKKIAVKINKVKLKIKSNSVAFFNAAKFKKPTNVTVGYFYFNTKLKRWRLLSASTCIVNPSRREICVFSQKKSGRIDYHGISFSETSSTKSSKGKTKPK